MYKHTLFDLGEVCELDDYLSNSVCLSGEGTKVYRIGLGTCDEDYTREVWEYEVITL